MNDEANSDMLVCPEHSTHYAKKREDTIGECPWCLQEDRDRLRAEAKEEEDRNWDMVKRTPYEELRETESVAGLIFTMNDDIQKLEGKIDEMKKWEAGLEAGLSLLLDALPDTDKFKDEDPSWKHAWNYLSGTAKLRVKSLRVVATAILERKQVYFQTAVPGLMADLPNVNGRIYPLEVIEKAVAEYQDKIVEKKALIYVEPKDPARPELSEVGGLLTELRVEGGVVYAKGHAINTPAGANLTSLLQAQRLDLFPCGKGEEVDRKVQNNYQLDHFSVGMNPGKIPPCSMEFKMMPEEGDDVCPYCKERPCEPNLNGPACLECYDRLLQEKEKKEEDSGEDHS